MLWLKLLSGLCLLLTQAQCIRIGISQNSNRETTTTTAATTTITSGETSVNILDLGSSAQMEATTLASFPPRKLPTTTSTTTTTTEAPDLNDSTTMPPPPTLNPAASHYPYYCACDLHPDQCDINCCCDRDCLPEALQVFNCLRTNVDPQLLLRLEDFHYMHGLPSCQLNDGWLCVFRTNTKPAKQQQPSNNFDASAYKKWPDIVGAYETTQLLSNDAYPYYKYGQPLQLWQPETKQVKSFELPSAYESAHCQLQQPVHHLEALDSSCLLWDAAELQQHLWTLLNLTETHKLLATPYSAEHLANADVDAVAIQICQQVEQTLVCNATDQLSADVYGIELQLFHNYTHIRGARLLLKQQLAMSEAGDDEASALWLHYAVEFLYNNETNFDLINVKPSTPSKATSGPLGYVPGAPILISRLLPPNNTELSYFAGNASTDRHWLMLFTKQAHSASCRRIPEQRYALQYGMDVAKQCQLQATQLPVRQHNYTDYCQRLQRQIWALLLPENCSSLEQVSQVFVSQLGRPEPNQWLPLQLRHNDGQLPNVYGEPLDELLGSFSCRNMMLTVRYEFHVAQRTLLNGQVPHQHVVQHAALVLGERHDLEFEGGEQQEVELPLAVSVMFYKQPTGAGHAKRPGKMMLILLLLTTNNFYYS